MKPSLCNRWDGKLGSSRVVPMGCQAYGTHGTVAKPDASK
jgi:hypothetical protein